MVLASAFAVGGMAMIGFLYLCWERYWRSVRQARGIAALFHRPGLCHFEELRPLYILREEFLEQEEAWYTGYHWCLLMGSVFFGLAVFCAVLHWTWEWPFWIHLSLSVLSGLVALLGCGYVGYGIVREKILPLDDGKVEEE